MSVEKDSSSGRRATRKVGKRRATDHPVGGSRAVAGTRVGRGGRAREAGEVSIDNLRWTCPPLKPSKKAPTATFLIGQERPMAALRTGLSIHARGYNVFVSGYSSFI